MTRLDRPTRRNFIQGFGGGLSCALIALDSSRAQIAPQIQNSGQNFRPMFARKAQAVLSPNGPTLCATYDGSTPGPLLRVKQGEDVRVRLINQLDQPTTLHWHGLRNDNRNDGVAGLTQPGVPPGGFFDYAFKAADSGMYLYRPAGVPADQAAQGLGGLLIVDEAAPPEVDHDFAFILQDWFLTPNSPHGVNDPNGPAAAKSLPSEGRIGPDLTANGAAIPMRQFFAPGARLRLRIANACASRIAILTFTGVIPFVMAIDGQPCDKFEPVRNLLPIAPGARFDLTFDLAAIEGAEAKILLKEGERLTELAAFKSMGPRAKERGPIQSLPFNETLPAEIRLGEARKLQLNIAPPKAPGGFWTINGEKRGYGAKPLLSVKRGTPISMIFANGSQAALAMHVHGVSMRLLHDLDDGWEPYWRNAVIIPKNTRKIVAFKMEAPGKWAVRSDIADQEAAGLASWIEAT